MKQLPLEKRIENGPSKEKTREVKAAKSHTMIGSVIVDAERYPCPMHTTLILFILPEPYSPIWVTFPDLFAYTGIINFLGCTRKFGAQIMHYRRLPVKPDPTTRWMTSQVPTRSNRAIRKWGLKCLQRRKVTQKCSDMEDWMSERKHNGDNDRKKIPLVGCPR
ncbi:hypothetical protein BDV27DRAFT_88803 [Aspergillus caelatus]|uniref:Uncharacterized protein n=1 Tax=Aspergillus caelatus TaxID=61420 RepID=A0A5N6ZK43_9EURO|nr:uncharacterized protein BDV27DRAFT_88803 [Aspergillus caelatus]KAE8357336.1 hypothetical protein BDV27DRAFT_88803 [Aspergillus caelatus]